MYDTIKLWLPCEMIKEREYLQRVPKLLTNVKETYKADTGEVYCTGSILGMSAIVCEAGISLKGSICKSYLKDNFKTLTRQDTQRAIEQIQDFTNLPILQADVRQIDFAQNLIVSQQPTSFYNLLGECQHYRRLVQPKSVYYKNTMRQKVFYSKVDEGKAKRQILPSIWANRHILRYELRYISRIAQQFNRSQLQALNLFNEAFYIEMVERWINEYENINKNNSILHQMNSKAIKKPNDYIMQLALMKINELGINEVMEGIEDLKAQNHFKHKEYYSRLKADIKKLCTTYQPDEGKSLINELDKKVMQVKEHYR
jgi:hypothetical protein